jgi:hypothetical protein
MKTFSILAAAALTLSALVAPASAAVPTTQLTLKVPGCDGCIVDVASYLYGTGSDAPLIWDGAKPKKVATGEVTFVVPTDRTPGLSITVRAPWEGPTGFVTNVVLRYKGEQTGDRVGFTAARAAKRATGCWAGTTQDAVTIKVVARKVKVAGYGTQVPGTIAYAKVTQDWLRPLVNTFHGVVGTQDLMPCKAAKIGGPRFRLCL